MKLTDKQIKNFWKKVNKNGPNGCWLWTGAHTKTGYGVFKVAPTNYMAHRISWMIANNSAWPPGLQTRHLCNTPACVNPSHLQPGTAKENYEDKRLRGTNKPMAGLPSNFKGFKIATPYGVFANQVEALKHINMCKSTLNKRLKQRQPGYYYIK